MPADDDALDRELSALAAEVSLRLAELSRDIWTLVTDGIPALRDDDLLANLLDASVEENVVTLLHVFEHRIEPETVNAPAAAVEYARRLAQRGMPIVALIRAYRIGHGRFLARCVAELAAGPGNVATLARMLDLSFRYIDRVSEQVIEIYQQERDRWLLTQSAVLVARLRDLLHQDQADVDAAEVALRYHLRQYHLCVVGWVTDDPPAADGLTRIDRLAVTAAKTLGSPTRPLFVPQDETMAWIWFPLGGTSEVRPDLLVKAFDNGDEGVRLAVGDPAAGLRGFRGSHRQALRTRNVALVADPGTRVTTFAEVGPVALLSADVTATRTWVWDTLAGLAVDDEAGARLRETLRVFLSSGASYTVTAQRMTLHKNSVQYRVRKAEEALGAPIQDRRAEVELALRACKFLGRAVLKPAAG
jgi:DNA-binding PucR family transcriptional regulator